MDPSVPIGTALALGSFTVAADVCVEEPPGDGRDRMKRAVDALAENLAQSAGDFFVAGSAPDVASLLDGTSTDDRRSFLIELVLADPFAPYWFEMTRTRDTARTNALRRLSHRSLDLDIDSVSVIATQWRSVMEAESKFGAGVSWKRIAAIGAGGAALAGLVVAAGPLIATAMPAAVGLNGAAAVSAGLAQLGFGSVAAGGLGMTGGLWMLGLAGGALGAGGTALGQATIKQLIAAAGSAHLIQHELCKLVLSANLANDHSWFGGSIAEFDASIDNIATAVDAELQAEEQRNDPKAPRVLELRALARTAIFAGEAIRKLPGVGSGSST